MNEIFVLKSVNSGVWVCLLFKKMMTEMSPAISLNIVTSFVNTDFFYHYTSSYFTARVNC